MTDISNNPHTFAISEIGDDEIIIGLDWIKKINPIINWKQGYMQINNKQSKITFIYKIFCFISIQIKIKKINIQNHYCTYTIN